MLRAGVEIAHKKYRTSSHASNEGHPLAIVGRSGAHGSARPAVVVVCLAGVAVETADGVDTGVWILVVFDGSTRRHVLVEVDILSLGGKEHLSYFLLIAPLFSP